MKIWIDLANSPQVLFFRPIMEELRRRGHAVVVTSRDYAETTELADLFGVEHTAIGSHGGSRLRNIGYRLIDRAWKMMSFARGQVFDLAVSHGSYAQALAAAGLRIPFITLMDYEHQPANHICFRLAQRVIVPECFPEWAIRKYGATSKALYYHGLKEQVYLADFSPKEDYMNSLGIPSNRIVVVMRPPASWSLYHRFENPLFHKALEYVVGKPDTHVVFLPRIPSQGDAVRATGLPRVSIPERPLDGPNLLYSADMAISAGGTMNREAAVLGAFTYSVFKGRLAAVDRYLIENGRMEHIQEEKDLERIQIQKRGDRGIWLRPHLPEVITGLILDGAS